MANWSLLGLFLLIFAVPIQAQKWLPAKKITRIEATKQQERP